MIAIRKRSRPVVLKEFFINYVDKQQPALIRGASKLSPAFEKWSEEYFRKNPKMADYSVLVEPKKENISMLDQTQKRMKFKDFLSSYRHDDLSIATSVPRPLQKDLLLPPVLRCKETRNKLYDVALWYSSGGTKSALHSENQDEINCLLRGRKDYLLLDHNIYKDKIVKKICHQKLLNMDETCDLVLKYDPGENLVQVDRGNAEYVNVDVDHVDFSRYPELEDVEWQYAAMNEGDCLYIPYKWIQQTNTYPNDKGEAIAVNVLFEHMHDHRPRSCSSDPQKATIDKFKFHFLVNEERNMKYREEMERKKLAAKGNSTDADGTDQEEEEDGNENDTPTVSMKHFMNYLQFKPSHTINFPQFLDILKQDNDLSHFKIDTGFQFPQSFLDPAKQEKMEWRAFDCPSTWLPLYQPKEFSVFTTLDSNFDGILTQEDFDTHSKKPKKDLQDLMMNLGSHIQYLRAYVEDLVEAKYHGGTIDEVEQRQIRKMKELRQKLTLHDTREF